MWLRWVVNNLISEIAENRVRRAVDRAHAALGRSGSAPDPRPPRPVPPCNLVFMFALGLESGGLVRRLSDTVTTECATFTEHVGSLDGRTVAVVESGVGREAARKAAEDLAQLHRPRWIVSAGFAGALVPSLRRRHILMADAIVDSECRPLVVPFRIDPSVVEATPTLHVGRLLTVDRLIRTREQRRQLAREYQAAACDMETMAVARVCRDRHVRFLSVRVISDAVDDTLPPEIEHLIDQASFAGKLGAATRAVFRRPGSLKDMWRLRDQAVRASERLADFLAGVVPQLENKASSSG